MEGENLTVPYLPPNPFGVKQVYWERIQNMRLLDDTLMTAALHNNIEATQFILRILMEKPDLIVTSATSQVEFKNLYGHSLRMDVDATDSSSERIDIEVERDRYRATPERSRYHLAIRDSNTLQPGDTFTDLPTVYLVFITEQDIFRMNRPLYHIDRVIKESGEYFRDRAHIIYANAAYEGDDALGRLMADFRESDPDRMHNPELAKRVRTLKTSENEVRDMCKAMEITYEEGREEGLRQGREEGREDGLRQGREDGLRQGREEGDQIRGVRDVENLMETLGLTLTESLRALRVPLELYQTYTNLIEQRRAAQG